jgi:Rad3-related DNA helicase
VLSNPRSRGLPHKEYRPYQAETIEWLENPNYDDDGNLLIKISEAPTGSGKSLVAMAVGGRYNAKQVIALTHTRNLQKQYQSVFPDCFVHWGRASYPCIHDYRVADDATADACLYPGAPKQCEYYQDCPYYIAKARSVHEPRVALNYAYWLTSSHNYKPKYLILDEAHMLSDITLEHVGTAVSEHDLKYWNLPEFPKLTPREIAIYTGEEDSTVAVGIWLVQASAMLLDTANKIANSLEENVLMARTTRAALLAKSNNARRASLKLETVANALNANPGAHWFIRCDESQGLYMGKPEKALVIRPITARYDFGKLFIKPDAQMLLMSATIGNVKVYAEELGIPEYDWRVVPNRWTPETRPVYILPVPSMGRRSVLKDETAWQVQADMIARAILEQPKHWCGLVLVTRKAEVLALSKRLAARGLAERIYPMVDEDGRTVPTEQQLQMWQDHKMRVPNAIGVSCNFWTGFDGVNEKILIIAKVPFPSLASDFEKARMSYSSTTFNWRTACLLEQGLGRTRRGNYQDYEVDGLHQGYVAIADDDFRRTKSYLSQSMLDAIVELPKGR